MSRSAFQTMMWSEWRRAESERALAALARKRAANDLDQNRSAHLAAARHHDKSAQLHEHAGNLYKALSASPPPRGPVDAHTTSRSRDAAHHASRGGWTAGMFPLPCGTPPRRAIRAPHHHVGPPLRRPPSGAGRDLRYRSGGRNGEPAGEELRVWCGGRITEDHGPIRAVPAVVNGSFTTNSSGLFRSGRTIPGSARKSTPV